MSSASELFSRRSRSGRTADLSPRRYFHLTGGRRRDRHHDPDGCDPPSTRHSRSIQHHHLNREQVSPDQNGSQSAAGNNTRPEDSRNTRNGQRFTGTDRLPGPVLLARERLLERLRGVSVSGNRQNNGASSMTHYNFGSDVTDLEHEVEDDAFATNAWLVELSADFDSRTLSPFHETRKRSPGLTQEDLDRLQGVVFSKFENSSFLASQDCSVCLENFEEGEKLTVLPCGHSFHCSCLNPWIQICGDCPNCRRCIL